jgi:hypothetical protein
LNRGHHMAKKTIVNIGGRRLAAFEGPADRHEARSR